MLLSYTKVADLKKEKWEYVSDCEYFSPMALKSIFKYLI